ncbi:uncharacterized protein I303_106641 [Kwoniella dejecticola CBS 10117]|uniref:Uncharacterized protein n=1 Tax=Kwoniella dejecticola CBS 10117 TaxID=1296121 RepID=A0A1A5ZU40_9TREE|nr:uncharacterized protein I303_08716 [Kwoniella dejecticola CBS 10117]OBR81329.1 hypothetical protein I303_08716 [Kwoniella dejecticola CBS 10117]
MSKVKNVPKIGVRVRWTAERTLELLTAISREQQWLQTYFPMSDTQAKGKLRTSKKFCSIFMKDNPYMEELRRLGLAERDMYDGTWEISEWQAADGKDTVYDKIVALKREFHSGKLQEKHGIKRHWRSFDDVHSDRKRAKLREKIPYYFVLEGLCMRGQSQGQRQSQPLIIPVIKPVERTPNRRKRKSTSPDDEREQGFTPIPSSTKRNLDLSSSPDVAPFSKKIKKALPSSSPERTDIQDDRSGKYAQAQPKAQSAAIRDNEDIESEISVIDLVSSAEAEGTQSEAEESCNTEAGSPTTSRGNAAESLASPNRLVSSASVNPATRCQEASDPSRQRAFVADRRGVKGEKSIHSVSIHTTRPTVEDRPCARVSPVGADPLTPVGRSSRSSIDQTIDLVKVLDPERLAKRKPQYLLHHFYHPSPSLELSMLNSRGRERFHNQPDTRRRLFSGARLECGLEYLKRSIKDVSGRFMKTYGLYITRNVPFSVSRELAGLVKATGCTLFGSDGVQYREAITQDGTSEHLNQDRYLYIDLGENDEIDTVREAQTAEGRMMTPARSLKYIEKLRRKHLRVQKKK